MNNKFQVLKYRRGFSPTRRVRILFLCEGNPPSPRTILIDKHSTYGDITDMLNKHQSLGDSDGNDWTVLQTVYGPSPYWIRADPLFSGKIEDNCQTLYAVGQTMPILALVRKANEDYPVAIFQPDSDKTISESFVQADSSLAGVKKSITVHTSLNQEQFTYSEDLSSMRWAKAINGGLGDPCSLTRFIITIDEVPGVLELDIPPTQPIPSFLQTPLSNCKELLQQSYDLAFYPLQMIHLSKALLHAISSLATTLTQLEAEFSNLDSRNMTVAIEQLTGLYRGTGLGRPVRRWQLGEILNPNPVYLETVQLLEVAPLLADNLERLMDRLGVIIRSADYDRRHQEILDQTFIDLCGDYPGAVAIRRSESTLKELKVLDQEKNGRRLAERVPTLTARVIQGVRRLLQRRERKATLPTERLVAEPEGC